MFLIEWLYHFIKTYNIKNVVVQLFLQILASLLFQKHESYTTEQSENKSSIIESKNEEMKSVKDYGSDKIIALKSDIVALDNENSDRKAANRYIVEDGKLTFPNKLFLSFFYL